MIKNLSSLWQKKAEGRIFISYRRDDTQWFAGRLADSLSSYFGDKRVFRDIEGIAGGANFAEVIRGTLKQSDATVVLIGDKWLSAVNDNGERRLDQADDWVLQEIVTALDAGLPVYPVLVGDTPMPRAEELPEQLHRLLNFNAISVGDSRWESDVDRLAKVIGLDIPSETERKLSGLNLLISVSLTVSLLICCFVMFRNLMCHVHWNIGQSILKVQPDASWQYSMLCSFFEQPIFVKDIEHWPFDLRLSAVPYIVIACCSALLFVFARLVEHTRRPWFLAAAWVGAIGCISAFIALAPVPVPYESLAMLLAALVIILSMLALMCLSGFRPK